MGKISKSLTAALLALALISPGTLAKGEDKACYVLCQPDSEVVMRSSPDGSREGAYMLGDAVTVDKLSDGWAHVVDAPFEASEGWMKACYLAEGAVEVYEGGVVMTVAASGRVKARKAPEGELRVWLKPGDAVVVYAMGGGWAVTDKGYVKSEYVEE